MSKLQNDILSLNYAIITCIIASYVSKISCFICPENPIRAHYPDPLNCGGYIYCVRGQPYPGTCDGDLYWDPKTKNCEAKEKVHCIVPPPSPPKPPASLNPGNVKPECSVTSKPVIMAPHTYPILFPKGISPPSNSEANSMQGSNLSPPEPANPETTSVKPKIPIKPFPGKFIHQFSCKNQPCGIYPNITDCSTFLLCSEGLEIIKHCNDGQLFDIVSLECQHVNKAQCWKEPVTEPQVVPAEYKVDLCSFHNKSSITNSSEEIVLNSPVVTKWGNWENWKYCPANSYVNGIYVWRQLVRRGDVVDQAGIASLSLNCADIHGIPQTNIESVATGAPQEGWPPHYTCSAGTAIGFQMNSQQDQGAGDDLATDNVKLICSCGKSVHKPYEEQTGIQSGNRGDWTKENICSPKQAICGMQTQMHDFNRDGVHDNTGLNNLNVKCCNVPSPVKSCKPVEIQRLIRNCSNIAGNFHRRCDFRNTIGLTYDFSASTSIESINFYQSIGYDLNSTKQELSQIFKDKLGNPEFVTNSTWLYHWGATPEKIWDEEKLSVQSVYLDVNTTSELYQIVGKCFIYEIKTNLIVKIDKNTRGESETTYYEI